MFSDHGGGDDVLRCRVVARVGGAAVWGGVMDVCGGCAAELEGMAVEVEVLDGEDRLSCDRCAHLSALGFRVDYLRRERDRVEAALNVERLLGARLEVAGLTRRARLRARAPF